MKAAGFVRAVGRNLSAQWRHLALASTGVSLGVGSLFLFLTIGSGLVSVVQSGETPETARIEVVPKPVDLRLGLFRLGVGGESISVEVLSDLSAIAGVSRVHPKARLTVPATVTGGADWMGSDLTVEIVAEGVGVELVAGDVEGAYNFDTFPGLSNSSQARLCVANSECSPQEYCVEQSRSAGVCRAYVPVLASGDLVDLYNDHVAKAHGLPRLDPEMLLGTVVDLEVGASVWNRRGGGMRRSEKARLVGFTHATSSFALAMPISFVMEMNALMRGANAQNEYHSAVLELDSTADTVSIQAAVEGMDLEFRGRGIERMTRLIRAGTFIAASASIAVVAVATVHVMHVFMLLASQRRRQIAVMRAVGASRRDVMMLVTAEACLIGLLSGVAAVGVAAAIGGMVEGLAGGPVRELILPFEDVLFSPSPSVALLCIGLSVACSAVGAVVGAAQTVMKDPAALFRG